VRGPFLLIALVGLAGCDVVFGLTPSETPAFDPCTPPTYDPARYRALHDAGQNPFSWSTARSRCREVGSDLAVLNAGDPVELGNQAVGAETPFWIGVSFSDAWTGIDGCTPALTWAPGQPSIAAPGQCVLVTDAGMASAPCGSEPSIDALCETPRPDETCQALVAHSRYQLLAGAPLTQPLAASACMNAGMHLVEINSSAELDEVRRTVAPGTTSFWLGAIYTGTEWTSPTQCPQVFTWAANEPSVNSGDQCAVYNGGARIASCTNAVASTICEANTP